MLFNNTAAGKGLRMKTVKKSINISEDLVKKVERSLKAYPGLNFTLVVNQALEQWLQGPQTINLLQTHQRFIFDNSEGFGPKLKK
jgi:hypothetical protein